MQNITIRSKTVRRLIGHMGMKAGYRASVGRIVRYALPGGCCGYCGEGTVQRDLVIQLLEEVSPWVWRCEVVSAEYLCSACDHQQKEGKLEWRLDVLVKKFKPLV